MNNPDPFHWSTRGDLTTGIFDLFYLRVVVQAEEVAWEIFTRTPWERLDEGSVPLTTVPASLAMAKRQCQGVALWWLTGKDHPDDPTGADLETLEWN